MEKLKTLMQHKWFMPAVCLCLGTLIIFIAGPYFAFAGYVPLSSILSRFLLATFIVTAYVMYVYILYLKRQAQQDSMVNAMIADDDDVSLSITAESKALKAKFTSAFKVLKQNKGAQTSLIDLPWYMIIGAPGSGKTTLLSNSGLTFPLAEQLDTKHVNGIGGTKNCDWWITNEAVLLDTAGRYTSQDSFQEIDKSGWQNFLGLIKRYRKKPISGLIVSISMSDLLSMNEYEVSQTVHQLKQRISDVNRYFNTQFPVYVMVTKTDVLAGFTQFYDTFSHQEREQAFGLTFKDYWGNKQGHKSDSKAQVKALSEMFLAQFSELITSVSRRQWSRMSVERDVFKKAVIYSFGDQLASLQQTLQSIVCSLAEHEENIDNAIIPGKIRGIYFTSGTQNGAPIDRMIARVSSAFGVRHSSPPIWNNDQRSYFIKDLLQQVVFKEADKFGTLASYQLKKSRFKLAAFGLSVITSVALCVGLYISFSNNMRYIDTGNAQVSMWLSEYQNKQAKNDIVQYVPALNDFANDINGLRSLQSNHFSGMGLNQARAVNRALNASYKRLLETVLLPYVKQQLELQMHTSDSPTLQYQALKSYLMLHNFERRSNEYLSAYIIHNMNPEQRFTPQQYLQIQGHLQSLIALELTIDNPNNAKVAFARAALNAQPLGEIYYQQFRDTYLADKSAYRSMAQLAGSNWRSVFSTTLDDVYTISTLYTPNVYDHVSEQAIANYIGRLNDEAWVLGPENLIDEGAMATQLAALYAKDYIQQWQNVLNSVAIKPVTDVSSLLSALPLLTQNTSPIFTLLGEVSKATNLTALTLPAGQGSTFGQKAQQGFQQAQATFNADGSDYIITASFTELHEATTKEKSLSTQQQLSALLQEINISLNLHAKNVQSISTATSLDALQGFAFLQLSPLDRWIDELTLGIKVAQSQIRKSQLSSMWQTQIVAQCDAIYSNKYPFQGRANQDATQADLRVLFSDTGVIQRFFKTHLAALVNTQTSPWTWKNGVNQNYQFDRQVLPFFEKVNAIRHVLYTKNPAQASADITLTPVYLDPKLSQIQMNIFGTKLSYQFGRPTPVKVSWPPQNPEQNSEIIFVRRDGSELALREKGLFGLFKLIDAKQVDRVSQNKVRVTFTKNEYKAIYEMSTVDASDPLLLSGFDNFSCLATL